MTLELRQAHRPLYGYLVDKRQEDWLWKEDKVGTAKGHRSRLKRSEQRDKKMNLSAGSCVQMTQPRSPAQGTK